MAQNTPLTESAVINLIALWGNATYDLAMAQVALLNAESEKVDEPFAPTVQEYADYKISAENIAQKIINAERKVTEATTMKENAAKQIISYLPAKNKWFKIGNSYVGVQTSDWPMATPLLRIQVDAPETELTKY